MGSLSGFRLVWFCLGMFLATCNAFPSDEVHALTAFKEAIYDDPQLVLSNWNPLDSEPCSWSGVYCSDNEDHVRKINISGASIRGFIAAELCRLSFLEQLILHDNNLIGSIPKEIGALKNLKELDLGRNQLAGPIPREIGNMASIMIINLESNGLTGRLPSELGNLKHLQELRLDRNKLQGIIPGNDGSDFTSNVNGGSGSSGNPLGFCRSSQLKIADFSFNFLRGSIPKCIAHLPRSSFQGNCLQLKDTKQRSAQQCATYAGSSSPGIRSHDGINTRQGPIQSNANHQTSSKPIWLLALEIVTGIAVGSVFLVALFTGIRRCRAKSSILLIPWKKARSRKDYMTIQIDADLLKGVVRFSRQELEVACEDFSNVIGSSSDSRVYKGTMNGGSEIAVISLDIKEEDWQGYLEYYYQKEVADLARLNHENTGKLLGYCRENSPFTRMLVFDYASNGTLYEHLHSADGEGCQLSWTRRMKIIIGIARGLKYLHTEIDPPFTLSEFSSSAVYLTEDFSPKLADFESWKTILSRSESSSRSISYEGAVCVLPNSLEGRRLDIQGNIYSFGLLLLEIISGRPPYCKDKGCLLEWAKEYIELPEEMAKVVVDPQLKHFREEDLKVICEVVALCLHLGPRNEVDMLDICSMLESKIDTSVSSELKASSLAWAELALSS